MQSSSKTEFDQWSQFHNDDVVRYLPNADFQIWFKPVAERAIICLILIVPTLVLLKHLGLLTPTLGLMIGYLHLFGPFLSGPSTAQTRQWVDLLSLFSIPIFWLCGLAVSIFTIKMTTQPDVLVIRPGSLILGKIRSRRKDYTDCSIRRSILWSEVSNIEIVRPPNTRSNLDYCLIIYSTRNPSIKIRFGDIINKRDRQTFINVLKNRFGQWIDDEAVAAFAPPRDRQSYTELWIAELSAPPKRDRLTPLEVGTLLYDQKYEVINRLGVGGQGTVYLAARGAEELVLKEFVLPVFPDPRVRKAAAVRFQDEANLLTKLDHPQIVKLKDLFLEDHRAYLVLEHLSGKNLKDLVAEQGKLPAAEVLRLAGQMAEILIYLHEQKPPVVHRDFTPDNLILDEDGSIKLIDFSVAQTFTSNVTGSVVGKPNYIAPEQFRGKPACQSDIYSMGATLYYLASGKEPEPITNLRLNEVLERPDPKLAKIIELSTRLDVTDRIQTARLVLQQLSS